MKAIDDKCTNSMGSRMSLIFIHNIQIGEFKVLARFWLQVEHESKLLKSPPVFLATYLNLVQKFGDFCEFRQILAIENLKKHLLLALLILHIAFWLHIYPREKKVGQMWKCVGQGFFFFFFQFFCGW